MSLDQLPLLHRGKVRDCYLVGTDRLLLVASDRLSAFDVVMAEPIPDKGRILTAMTAYFLETVADVAPSALVAVDPAELVDAVPELGDAVGWQGRTMLMARAEMLPLECIVRARLAGQAFTEYAAHGTIHGEPAPSGLQLAEAFPEPRFTPSTKAESGHDQNISFAEAVALVGPEMASAARAMSLAVFARASAALSSAGLVLADTKFELGLVGGELVLCDEVCTPDSSRIWPAGEIVLGETPPAFDKQPFRDWLESEGWDKQPPAPPVPEAVIAETAARYRSAYEQVTGRSLDDWYGAQ